MLRIQKPESWTLIEHREHARLAGRFAEHWGNVLFAPPQPLADILVATARHDDAWAERDTQPSLTREGRPSAFSRELVGKYSAFEEIDFLDYLKVRERATEAVASENPYAAIIVSMHTVNLLTEQADLSKISDEERAAHTKFIAAQIERQAQLATEHLIGGRDAKDVEPEALAHAFKFLQACDNLSLLACVSYPNESPLRHEHLLRDGTRTRLHSTPLGNGRFKISPYPFDRDELILSVPGRTIPASSCCDLGTFRDTYSAAKVEDLCVTIVRSA